ncbi:MAG TPA: hypothetical protein VM529_03545 [Gemmata sp.]|jgi:hypothetical protein|nr:hypothetical protein [Gemmata sp.]
MADARSTLVVTEVMTTGTADARSTLLVTEAMTTGTADARVTLAVVEALVSTDLLLFHPNHAAIGLVGVPTG